ncbi:DUF4268 domain-containing protein [Echinicola sp. 20G]|uniref:DUF4268 domain-containing protein n=1 Tax=Echinicola sp. 20G TaxID=2781961 RepID=UPI001910D26F|nr:DUF4268 domain-containing protein [Echinicola sp. 20G]
MNIGKLEKVDPRQLWLGEASDFTPWLARESNIEYLSEVIGLELEIISEEKSVGPFRADILCKSLVDDSYVLIENQLEKTDHTHLGQLITYAAGLDAVKIIWISIKFTEEHRAALDWLNRHTDEKLQFFGIELEVYRIGESSPAPLFQMISKPNDWSKAVTRAQKTAELTDTKLLNLEFWTAMRAHFEQSGSKLKCQKPQPQHWTNFAIGRSDFNLAAVASFRDNFVRVEFNLLGPKAKDRFDLLKSTYEDNSREFIGQNIEWQRLDEKIVSIVSLTTHIQISDKENWQNPFDWLLLTLVKFDTFFRTKIKQLP